MAAVRHDTTCSVCGTPVMSLASRCKQCGNRLREATPAVGVPTSAGGVPPVGGAVVGVEDSVARAAARRAAQETPERAPRSWTVPVVIAVVAIAAGLGTWLLVRGASNAERDPAAALAAPGKPAPLPPMDDSDRLPGARIGGGSAPGGPLAVPPAPPSVPPPMFTPPGAGIPNPGFTVPPQLLPPGVIDPFSSGGMPSLKDLMQAMRGGGLGGAPPDPAALQFIDKAFAVMCDKAASCGLVPRGDQMSCEMLTQGLMSGALAQALAPQGGQCQFNAGKAAQCIQLLEAIDCSGGSATAGTIDPMQVMELMQRIEGCSEAFACL